MSCHAANIAVVIAMIRGMSLSKQITVEHCLIHAPLILQHGKLVRCWICSCVVAGTESALRDGQSVIVAVTS
jgi:hypothetical protein